MQQYADMSLLPFGKNVGKILDAVTGIDGPNDASHDEAGGEMHDGREKSEEPGDTKMPDST